MATLFSGVSLVIYAGTPFWSLLNISSRDMSVPFKTHCSSQLQYHFHAATLCYTSEWPSQSTRKISLPVNPQFPPSPSITGERVMLQQGDGWPLGLQPLNVRVGIVRNRDLNGSVSFNTLLTGSPTSSPDSSSSDLDTESTGSFFHDKSITLGSLIGVSSILALSRRSTRGKTAETLRDKKHYKPKPWLFSICSKLSTDAVTMNNTPSLQQFLEAERRAANIYNRNQNPITYGPENISRALPVDHNALLVIGNAAAPDRSSPCMSSDDETRSNEGLYQNGTNGYGNPLLLSCLCGHLTH